VQRQLDILHQRGYPVRPGHFRDGARPDGGAAQVAAEAGASWTRQRDGSWRAVAQLTLDSLTMRDPLPHTHISSTITGIGNPEIATR